MPSSTDRLRFRSVRRSRPQRPSAAILDLLTREKSRTRFLSGDIGDAVATAAAAAQGKNLLVLGANIVQQCLAQDLVDEIVLFVLPVFLGDGVRLFATSSRREILFETVDVARTGQVAILRFRRRR